MHLDLGEVLVHGLGKGREAHQLPRRVLRQFKRGKLVVRDRSLARLGGGGSTGGDGGLVVAASASARRRAALGLFEDNDTAGLRGDGLEHRVGLCDSRLQPPEQRTVLPGRCIHLRIQRELGGDERMLGHFFAKRKLPHHQLDGRRAPVGRLHRLGQRFSRDGRRLLPRHDRVGFADREFTLHVELGIPKQSNDDVVLICKHDVALVIQLDHEVALKVALPAGEHDDAIAAQLLDLVHAPLVEVLSQFKREN